MLSDDSTSDSDSGIRFKTDSTRREKEEEAELERNRNKGRDNRRNFSPERRREGFQPGNRDRNDRRPFNMRDRSPLRDRGAPFRDRQRSPVRDRPRSPLRDRPRSPIRDRERSPIRDKGRIDRFSRDERKPRDSEQHRLPRSDGNDHIRSSREKPNDNTRPSGDIGGVARNGSRGDNHSSSRSQGLPKNDRPEDNKHKRDIQKLHDRSQRFSDRDKDVSEAELKRKEESKRRLEDRQERSRSSHLDVKERLNLKRDDKHSEETSGVRNSCTHSTNEKQDKAKDRTLLRQHSSSAVQNKSKISSESRGKSAKEVSIDKERESSAKSRAKSPITFSKSSSKDKSSKHAEIKKISKPEKAPLEIRRDPVTAKVESSNKLSRKSVSPELEPEEIKQDLSDTEAKPVSYYNMISDVPNEKDAKTPVDPSDEPIAVSDSSGDEAALRRKLLLLEKELKKTKVKRKSKHKDKKSKKGHKKSKSSSKDSDTPSNSDRSTIKIHSLPDESMSMKVTIRSDPLAVDSEKRIVSQANVSSVIDSKSHQANLEISDDEEGEIFSDGEDVEAVDTSDLRHRLGRQIGPALPTIAGAKSKSSADLRERLSSRTVLEGVSGPALPPHMRGKDDVEEPTEVEGPALPPHLMKPSKDSNSKTMGPTLPADMREKLTKTSKADATINVDSDTEQHTDDSDEEADASVVGPLPPGSEKLLSSAAHRKLEERALKMKIGSLEGYDDKDVLADKREEWMLELPDVKAANLGLGPRQFRARAGPDLSDRSSWTDTPELKALKAAGVPVVTKESASRDIQRDAEVQFIQQRDAEQEMAVKKHKKKSKRNESLVEIHQKKLEKKKKKERKEDGGSKRRPFDRDIDLKANKFDEAQKKSIMKKAQLLDTRFSSGESKFL